MATDGVRTNGTSRFPNPSARRWQASDGTGVIWNGGPLEPRVIPAKAGIQSDDSTFAKVCGVDSRFCGNDCGFERPCLANDTSTHEALALADLFQRLLPQQPGAGEEDE